MSVILFLAILAVLIFVHELGHFTVAKLSGIKVEEFAIGFPPRIFGWKYGETRYTINLIPFGGFVKIFGENSNKESLEGSESDRSFIRKPRPIQALVLIAGIAFNILFAWILFSGALFLGVPAPADSSKSGLVENTRTTVVEILPESPAEKAGFEVGDKLVSLSSGGKVLRETNADSMRAFIGEHGTESLSFGIVRGREEKLFTLEAIPESGIVEGKQALGFALADIGTLSYPLPKALVEGVRMTYSVTVDTTLGLLSFIGQAILGNADINQVTGPVGIAGMVADASDFGLAYLLSFAAFISINLAIINLLPFPALDGGRLFIVGIEGVIRRNLNYSYVNLANAAGFALLILLMILVTWQDIARLIAS